MQRSASAASYDPKVRRKHSPSVIHPIPKGSGFLARQPPHLSRSRNDLRDFPKREFPLARRYMYIVSHSRAMRGKPSSFSPSMASEDAVYIPIAEARGITALLIIVKIKSPVRRGFPRFYFTELFHSRLIRWADLRICRSMRRLDFVRQHDGFKTSATWQLSVLPKKGLGSQSIDSRSYPIF